MLDLSLKSIAQKENLHIRSDASLMDLIRLMNTNGRGVVAVLKDNKAIGIMTERDVVELLYSGIDLNEKVDGHAKKALVSTRGDRTLGYAINLTLENNIRRVIVTDEGDNFLGIVTQQDLLRFLEEDFYRLSIKVKHIIRKAGHLISVSTEETLNCVLKKMIENKISAVPVIRDGEAVGIITEKDILKLACENVSSGDRVDKYMSSPVDTASPDTPLVEVVEVMNFKNIRRMVVVNGEGIAINVVTIRDVIENFEGDYNKFLERKLRNAKEILNMLPEMLIEVTDTGEEQLIIWANDKVIEQFGRGILDKPVTGFFPAGSWDRIYGTLIKLNRIEHIKIKKDDRIFELSGFFLKIYGEKEKGRVQLILRDITEDIKSSSVDPLTNIYNRRFINGFLIKEIDRCKRSDRHLSIVISDIDNFKTINDSYGHLSGDTVLKTVSTLMTNAFRNLDVVGRYGGDEFMIILPETTNKTASQIIERFRKKIENTEITLPKGMNVKVTFSFGIATFPDDGTLVDDLLVAADERLYKVKGSGKNKIACR
ncbi:MAG: diguanylate cyclase [Nitrospiraceae bacterium]|nr:MAG: diguanylate cyclase [Nitrospiraceae bacterium]